VSLVSPLALAVGCLAVRMSQVVRQERLWTLLVTFYIVIIRCTETFDRPVFFIIHFLDSAWHAPAPVLLVLWMGCRHYYEWKIRKEGVGDGCGTVALLFSLWKMYVVAVAIVVAWNSNMQDKMVMTMLIHVKKIFETGRENLSYDTLSSYSKHFLCNYCLYCTCCLEILCKSATTYVLTYTITTYTYTNRLL
jgi:hypothetical protein